MSQLLYHITHIENLQSIINEGCLWSHARINEHILAYHDVANHDVQSRRKHTKIPVKPGGYLHDYVPFYFAPRSPMLYAIKTNQIPQDNMIYFMTNIDSILKHSLPFVFTDAHAIRRLTNFYTDLSCLDQVDWEVMRALFWADTEDDPNRKARRQAEFLVHHNVPLSACLGFAVYRSSIKQKVKDMLKSTDQSLPVAVRRHFYY